MPALSGKSFGFFANRNFRHIAAGQHVNRYRSGRLALAEALKRSAVGPGTDVLVPAYHCQSIVEPIEAIGGRAVYYRILGNLQPDLDDIASKLLCNTRSLIAVHFFGIKAELSDLRALCDRVGATLVEDCAHCFSYSTSDTTYGKTGDFVITSPRKFLPICDGGELFSPGNFSTRIRQTRSGARYHLKMAANTIERAWTAHRENDLTANDTLQRAQTLVEVNSNNNIEIDYVDPRFDYAYASCRPSLSATTLKTLISFDRVVQLRRKNFAKLQAASQSFRRASAIIDNIESDFTPYVFPILVNIDDDVHSQLRTIGVPMWRWDDIRNSDCEISKDYSKRLIQLPCHQELTPEAIDQVIGSLLCVLG